MPRQRSIDSHVVVLINCEKYDELAVEKGRENFDDLLEGLRVVLDGVQSRQPVLRHTLRATPHQ